ncbi:unnamed protein product [Lactuca saligna]|uniref:SWIM-type domain-containing protein n=1 Tax=Lactuca saligna TaxID=75948 RepID=A0AA35YPG7_LACSI|nr:unnamed protein product [Lactuca saligna]
MMIIPHLGKSTSWLNTINGISHFLNILINPFKFLMLQTFMNTWEGFPNTSPVDTLDPKTSKIKRRVDTSRTGCKARIHFKIFPGTTKWLLYEFEEKHNHPLIPRDHMLFSRHHRQLDDTQKSFILTMSTQNIGATIAHRLYTSILGGYNFVGSLIDDFKNYMRDLNCFIGGKMLVDKLNNRKENVENFSFDYRVENKQLNALFWADETSKINYKEFGDVVSFDATFRTNRYHMVFVPFTGIDNHKRCVTFGVGLLSREDTDSYIWSLKSFLKAFGKQPLLVLSDQYLAMQEAIETVFPQSIHRLCMWHITSKLPLKVSLNIVNNPEFRKKFNFLIWNSRLEVDDFEIPAFFKHVPLSGLMRTTSSSESENSTFHQNTHCGSMLVHFMISFEAAMEKQRFTQSSFDFKTNDKHPIMRTPFEIERNASMFYTRTVFRQVQNEMYLSMVSCTQISINTFDDVDECLVKEFIHYIPSNANAYQLDPEVQNDDQWDIPIRESTYKVTHNKSAQTFTCPCMKFEQFLFLCRHIFTVMKTYNIKEIPSKYLLRRCNNHIKLKEYLEEIKQLEAKFLSNFTIHDKGNKNKEFEKTLGVTIPTSVDIQNPVEIRNKGSGTKKRMKSSREVTTEKSKGSRCGYCRNGNDHDWRNCPVRKEDEKNNIVKERPGKKN